MLGIDVTNSRICDNERRARNDDLKIRLESAGSTELGNHGVRSSGYPLKNKWIRMTGASPTLHLFRDHAGELDFIREGENSSIKLGPYLKGGRVLNTTHCREDRNDI